MRILLSSLTPSFFHPLPSISPLYLSLSVSLDTEDLREPPPCLTHRHVRSVHCSAKISECMMHGRGEIIRPVSGKGKGGLPRTASAGRIGAGNTLPRLRSGERKEGRRGGRDRREKRRRVNSLFLEAPLKRPPKLPPFSSPVPALTSLSLSLSSSLVLPSLSLSFSVRSFTTWLRLLFSLSLSLPLFRFIPHTILVSLFLCHFLPSSFFEERYTVEKKKSG